MGTTVSPRIPGPRVKSVGNPIGVGVIGLGRRWQRYQPALRALPGKFQVRAVCDELPVRAEREARTVGARVTAGPVELLEQADVEAVFLCDEQWYGLWPLERACRAGKPVLCAPPPDLHDAEADRLPELARDRRAEVLFDCPFHNAPATAWLHAALAERLGPVRSVKAELLVPGTGGALRRGAEAAVTDWCLTLLGAEPQDVAVQEEPSGGLRHVLLLFPEGPVVSLRSQRGAVRTPRLRVRIEAERGRAGLVFPRGVGWRDAEGRHTLRLTCRGGERRTLEHFAEVVRRGRAPEPGLPAVCRALRLLRPAAKS
jgi:predicted dehydrogenase